MPFTEDSDGATQPKINCSVDCPSEILLGVRISLESQYATGDISEADAETVLTELSNLFGGSSLFSNFRVSRTRTASDEWAAE